MDANIFIGIVSLIIAIIGVNYAIKTYRKDHIDTPNNEKVYLLAQFKATQKLSLQTYDLLLKFVEYYDAGDKEMWEGTGITYNSFLSEMKKSHEKNGNLSNDLYENLRDNKTPSITIQSHVKSLEGQFEALNLIHKEFTMKAKNQI